MASSTTTLQLPRTRIPFFSSSLDGPTVTLPPVPAVTTNNQAPNTNTGGVIDSGALYLYTFLATLVLLLSVSCAIVFRSLIIRRRRNRYIAEAIANGTWIPRSAFRDPGTTPTLFEAHLPDTKHPPGSNDELEWDAITPFSATYVNAPSTDVTSTTNKAGSPSTTPRSPITRLLTTLPIPRPPRLRLRLPIPLRTTTPTPSLPLSTLPSALPDPAPSTPSTLRVAVLIAMPSPSHTRAPGNNNNTADNEDEVIPHVEFGVAEVGVHTPSTPAAGTGIAPGTEGPVQTRSDGTQPGDGR